MVEFTQTKIERKQRGRKPSTNAFPPEVVKEYSGYIKALKRGFIGELKFANAKEAGVGRKHLLQVAKMLKKALKVSRKRGSNIINFQKAKPKKKVAKAGKVAAVATQPPRKVKSVKAKKAATKAKAKK